MPGQDHCRHLVTQLLRRESEPGFGVTCGLQKVEQVADGALGRRFRPGCDDRVHETGPFATKATPGDVARRGNGGRQEDVEDARLSEPRPVTLNHGPERPP